MQKLVDEFNQKRNAHLDTMPVSARLMDIASEMGELAKEYLHCTNYGSSDFEINEDFKLELGDVLYSLLSLASEVNLDAKDCLTRVIQKYQARIDKKKSMGSEEE